MKLTGNALSMLLKRYRAVLGKCRTLNWLAGLVLAGGLVLGGVSGALATAYNSSQLKQGMTAPVEVTENSSVQAGSYTLTIASSYTGLGLRRQDFVGLEVNGASVTLSVGNGVTFANSVFTPSAEQLTNVADASPGNKDINTAVILVRKGTLEITGGAQFIGNKLSVFGAVTTITGSGQTITISGEGNKFLRNQSGGAGAAIANFGKTTMTLNSVSFSENMVTGNLGGYGGGAVFMGADSTNLIAGATFDGNKVTSADFAWGGAIATRDPGSANMHNGTLTIGNSTFTDNYAVQRGGAIYNAFYNAFQNYATTLTTAPSGITTALIDNSTFSGNQVGQGGQGGAIYNDGAGDQRTETYTTPTPAKLTISNSEFTNNSAKGGQGGAIWNSGELWLINDTFSGNTAEGGLGDDIYNADTGVLNVAGGTSSAASTTSIGSGIYNLGTINIAQYSKLTGNMSLKDLLASTGASGTSQVNIAAGGALLINNPSAPQSTLDLGQIVTAANTTGTGGKITIQNTGASTIFVNDLVLTNTGGTDSAAGSLSLGNAGTILGANKLTIDYAGGINLTKGIINIQGQSSTLGGTGAFSLAGASASDAKLNLGVDSSGQSLQATGGTIQTDVTVTTGTMTVNAGSWSLGSATLDVTSNGYLVIGSAGKTATLDVQNGTFKNGSTYTADTKGTSILSGGALVINSSQLFKDATTLSDDIQAFNVAQGGMVNVLGYQAENNKLELDDFKNLRSAVMGSTGMLNLDGVSIVAASGTTLVDSDADSASTSAVVGGTGAVFDTAVTVLDKSGYKVAGGYAAEGLVLDSVTGSSAANVAVNGNVTLLGGAEGGLISGAENGVVVTLAAGKSLNLGLANDTAGLSTDAKLNGSVTLGADDAGVSSALNAATASYTITGTVTGDTTTAKGIVSASNGGTLTIENSGDSPADKGIDGVTAVNTSNGGSIIVEKGGISTTAINANGGAITAQAGAITTTTADVSNGAIVSAAVATTTNDAITATSTTTVGDDGIILSKGGNISLQAVTLNGGSIGIGTNQPASRSRAVRATEITPGLENLTTANGNITATGTVTAAANSTNVIKTTNGAISFNGTTNSVVVNNGASLDVEATGGDITFDTATDINDSGTLNITAKASEGASPGGNVIAKDDLTATSIIADGDITADTNASGGGGSAKDITATQIQAGGTVSADGVTANGAGASITAKKLDLDGTLTMNGGTGSTPATLTIGSTDAEGTAGDASSVDNLVLTNVTTELLDGYNLSLGISDSTISGGEFNAQNSTVTVGSGGLNLTGGVTASYKELAGSSAGDITVGAAGDTAQSSLSVGLLSADSALNLVGGANAPTLAAIGGISATAGTQPSAGAGQLNGNITVGKNSALALGSSKIEDANKVDAANGGLYLAKPVTVTGKQINVGVQADGTTAVAGATDTLSLGVDSSTVVDVSNLGSATAITGKMAASDGAKLTISGAQAGQDYKIISGDLNNNGLILASDNPLVQLSSADLKSLSATVNSASNFLPELDADTAAMLNSAANQLGTSGKNSSYRGIAFLSSALAMLNPAVAPAATPATANVKNRAVGDPTITSGPVVVSADKARLVTKTIEGAERMVVVGAVPQMTRIASQAAAEAVTQRTSMAIPSGVKTQQATDKVALWVMPLYQSANGAGMDAGKLDADFNGAIGGIALGADYTFANAIRAGISFNIGGGYATGGGDFADTTNNMNFWGLGAYAGWAQDNIGLSADVSFTSAYNKLSQDLPSEMSGWKDLKADVRSWALATGVKAEYKFETSALDIIPHLGVRYMYLNAEDYKLKSDGTVFKGDAMRQNIWTFPVGVNFSRSFQTASGWNVKPMADLMIVPALGDINANPTGRFTGPDYKVSDQNTQIMDHVTYQGQLGLEFGSDNLNFGLSGSAQFGEKTSGYGVLGSFRYEF